MNAISPTIRKNCKIDDSVVIRKHIVIDRKQNPMSFIELFQDAIDTLEEGDIGKKLIQKIEEGSHNVNIIYSDIFNTAKSITCFENATDPSAGFSTEITITLQCHVVLNCKAEPIESPFEVVLAHELIHSYHNSYGLNQTLLPMSDTEVWTNQEEYNTIMGNSLIDGPTPICENAIRKEQGLPERFSHWNANCLTESLKSKLISAAQLKHNPVAPIQCKLSPKPN